MKSKRALKRLGKVETLLSKVLDQYGAIEKRVRELLDSARAEVVQAKKAMKRPPAAEAKKKPKTQPAKAQKPKRPRVKTAAIRKKISPAPKKRRPKAKRRSRTRSAPRPDLRAQPVPSPSPASPQSDTPEVNTAPTGEPEGSTQEQQE